VYSLEAVSIEEGDIPPSFQFVDEGNFHRPRRNYLEPAPNLDWRCLFI
jgi:hypothetical protein